MGECAEERVKRICGLYRDGKTMQQIADELCISRQRVQVLISKGGMSRDDGVTDRTRVARVYGIDSVQELDRYVKRFPGCLEKYRQQKRNAKARGIDWGFTLRTWVQAWGEKWSMRGIGGEALVMCRNGDVGPYAPGNVYLANCGQNAYDYRTENRRHKR